MDIGISSSCLYPMKIEDSLRTVGELGARTAEIFMNSFSELKAPILTELCSIRDYYGIDIRSMHPFTSSYEYMLLFGNYARRTDDSVDFYKMYFEAAEKLDCEILVLHGGRDVLPLSAEEYAERYMKLNSAAKEFGIRVGQENVNLCQCSNPDFMKAVCDLCDGDFSMVLDIKQCRRSGQSEKKFIELLGDKICQVHLSDFNSQSDCLPPGKGEYDFKELFDLLDSVGYDISAVVELYRKNYDSPNELKEAMNYLKHNCLQI